MKPRDLNHLTFLLLDIEMASPSTRAIGKVVFYRSTHSVVALNTVHTGDKVEFKTVDFVESRLLPKPATNRQQSRLLPYTFNFVASVYGAKATWSTLSTFNKVEFNFVASVYRASQV